jgi:hypothetical protein
LKWLFFLDLSMVDRRLHDDLRKIYLHLKAPRFDLHRTPRDTHATAQTWGFPSQSVDQPRSCKSAVRGITPERVEISFGAGGFGGHVHNLLTRAVPDFYWPGGA